MEQDRLDLKHHLWLLTLKRKLHLVLIEDIKGGIYNVLDMATGTGIWAIDFGEFQFLLFISPLPASFGIIPPLIWKLILGLIMIFFSKVFEFFNGRIIFPDSDLEIKSRAKLLYVGWESLTECQQPLSHPRK